MGKRRPSLSLEQLTFSFSTPDVPALPGDLKSMATAIASGIARMLNDDARSREAIAEAVSLLLGERVSRQMLDAYASEQRESHRAPAYRFLALTAVTGRYDILDATLFGIGARALTGAEMVTAELGHLHAQRAEIDDKIRSLRSAARPFRRSRA